MPDSLDQSKAVLTLSPAAIRASFGSVVSDDAIELFRATYGALRIDGPKDREGYEIVHDARMRVRDARLAIDKKRKALKADALEYERAVDGEARRLIAALEPIEEHLSTEEERIDVERARLKLEAEAARKAKLDERVAKLAAIGRHWAPSFVDAMRDSDFELALVEETALYKKQEAERLAALEEQRLAVEAELAERKRFADEEAKREEERRQERERLAAERLELERQRVAMDDAQATLDEQRVTLERERRAAEPVSLPMSELADLSLAGAPVIHGAATVETVRKRDREAVRAVADALAAMPLAELTVGVYQATRRILDVAARELRAFSTTI